MPAEAHPPTRVPNRNCGNDPRQAVFVSRARVGNGRMGRPERGVGSHGARRAAVPGERVHTSLRPHADLLALIAVRRAPTLVRRQPGAARARALARRLPAHRDAVPR